MKNKCSAHLMDKWQIMNNTIDTKKNIHGASLLHHFVVIRATQTHQNPNSKSPARILSCPRNLRTAAWPSRPPQHCVLFCWSAFGSAHRQTHKHEHTNPRTLLSQVTYKLSSVLFLYSIQCFNVAFLSCLGANRSSDQMSAMIWTQVMFVIFLSRSFKCICHNTV